MDIREALKKSGVIQDPSDLMYILNYIRILVKMDT